MARLSAEEKRLKLKSVREAFEYLKSESRTKKKNLAIPTKICDLANSYDYIKRFDKKISVQSLKQPSGIEFKALKKEIDDFKNNFKIIKNSTDQLTRKKIEELNEKVELLTFQLSELIDNEIKLRDELDSVKKALNRSNSERDDYYVRLCALK